MCYFSHGTFRYWPEGWLLWARETYGIHGFVYDYICILIIQYYSYLSYVAKYKHSRLGFQRFLSEDVSNRICEQGDVSPSWIVSSMVICRAMYSKKRSSLRHTQVISHPCRQNLSQTGALWEAEKWRKQISLMGSVGSDPEKWHDRWDVFSWCWCYLCLAYSRWIQILCI